jgi:L-aminopeptidase/D-esterase-like protein
MSGSIVDVPGVRVGHAANAAAGTGCTVVAFDPAGAVCGFDARGSAVGTRATDSLAPTATIEIVHAILLTGGSAFGLDAVGGVMAELEAQGVGLAIGPLRIPIVPGAVIFDLLGRDSRIRPDHAMGAAAMRAANRERPAEGRAGAGMGALVAKLAGIEHARPGGLGSASVRRGALVVGALAVCNAVGNIYDPRTREPIALPVGAGRDFDAAEAIEQFASAMQSVTAEAITNTTLAVVVTNAALRRVDATKVAQMAHDGFARAIDPVHTTRDGDAIFAASTGNVSAPLDVVGVMAADAVAQAIVRGVRAACGAEG